MKYYCNLYLDEKTASKRDAIVAKLEQDQWQFEVYLIALPHGKQNHLELYHSALLLQKAVSKEQLFVVGLASGYTEALELIEKITQEVYDETAGTDIRNYILKKQEKFEKGIV